MTVLHLLSGGAAKGVVGALAQTYLRIGGVPIDGAFGAVGVMRDRLLSGEACDVVILTAALVDELAASGHVAAGSAMPLGGVATGVAVRRGDPSPDVHDGASLVKAFLAASSIHFPDPKQATAGIHFAKVLARLGIEREVASRLKPWPSGAVAMAHLADAKDASPIGCTQVTEILYTEGVSLVGLLPPGFELVTTYTAAVCTKASQPEQAARLVALLSGPDSEAIRVAGGFEP